jgi:transcriptional regulator with XRE-family HTH domain
MQLPLFVVGQLKNKKLLQCIATQVKELRSKKNLTQEDVYNDTNIHLARIETGKVNISVSTLKYLCDYFEISLSDFFEE